MTVLKTVEDVGATLAWYPGPKPMVALGTTEASGAGFDDYGARLELHALDLTDESATSKPAAPCSASTATAIRAPCFLRKTLRPTTAASKMPSHSL